MKYIIGPIVLGIVFAIVYLVVNKLMTMLRDKLQARRKRKCPNYPACNCADCDFALYDADRNETVCTLGLKDNCSD